MSKQTNNDEPAFIISDMETPVYHIPLRDWFAGQALAGELASQAGNIGEYATNISQCLLEKRATMLWRFADAMIAAREKGQQ